ncbi:CoA-transferase family III [Penicillium atrosanguineum]|uniref:CoA-transferase family III n=1 Tax=Penicillium atrosanguineum TaxID=1132637 RepID=UPI0023868296|nr:CoA-transferase family III [Penicillium atrosanguineum]KAJ5309685.1 CoA-transferase family III [Penicillium atrosanguineum]
MSPLSDPTFSNYDQQQAQQYAESRLSYPERLYNTIIDYHIKSRGQSNILVDVGCGPGNATRDMATWFDHAVGLDPSVEMINTAMKYGSYTKSGQELRYAVYTADQLSHGVQEVLPIVKELGGVDLLAAAMAPINSATPDPSTANADAVQKVLFELEREILSPYELPSNRLSRDLYENLILPWDLDDESLASEFPASQFQRLEWDRDGILTDGDQFFNFSDETTLEGLETDLGTASMVTRWREAHPELANTENDCVKQTMAKLRLALGVGGTENPTITVGNGTVILLFKRKCV